MPKVIEHEGRVYHMPDDATDAEIANILDGEKQSAAPEDSMVVSPQVQADRDAIAAQIRGKEVGNDPKKIKETVVKIENALQKRPINADVRKMLQRELSFWKILQEQQGAN